MAEHPADADLAWLPLYTSSDRPDDPALLAAARGGTAWQAVAAASSVTSVAPLLAEGFDGVRLADPALVRALAAGDAGPLAGLPPAALTVGLPLDATGARALSTLRAQLPQVAAVPDLFDHLDGLSPAPALALALAAGVHLLRASGADAAQCAANLLLPVTIGSEVATGLCRLRASRATWRAVQAAFGVATPTGGIFARAARANWTAIDAHGNLIRSTLAAFVAAAGGADRIEPLAYDPLGAAAESRRLALNQLHLLRHEAGVTRVHDPAGGSYAIEAGTQRLAHAAWALFQRIEAAGGFAKAPLAKLVAASPPPRVVVGANRFADPRAPLSAIPEDDTDRAARPFERLRARSAALSARPRAVLLPYGPTAPRRAAAEFAAEFLRLAGIDVDDHAGFRHANEMARALAAARPPLAILCGDLADGGRFVRDALPVLRAAAPAALIYATGRAPTGSERWGHVGFLHDGLDALGTLEGIVTRLEDG